MSWRHIVSVFVGSTCALFGLALFLLTDTGTPPLIRSIQLSLVCLCAAGVLIAVPLWTGRLWALIALRGALLLGWVLIVVLSIIDFQGSKGALAVSIGNIAFYGSVLATPTFVLTVLFHPNVRAEYSGRGL